MRKTITGVLAALFILAAVPAWALRIAFVDVNKVVAQYEGTKDAKEKLSKQRDAATAKLEADRKKLQEKADELESKKKALTEQKYREQAQALSQEVMELRKRMASAEDELVRAEKEKMSQILDEIREVVNKIADNEKWDYVFTADSVLYGGVEITASVVKALNVKK